MEPLRFIHCADLHIDSPFKGISKYNERLAEVLNDSTFRSFENIVDYAISEKVDFVLFAGDIYDGENKSLRAQIRFNEGLKKLSDARIYSYIVCGNHDPLNSRFDRIKLPEKAHIFRGDEAEPVPFEKDGEIVAYIYGISFPKREVYENLSLKFNRIDNNIPAIALLHCNIDENTGYDNYAPASVEDLISRNMDYWALGHIHKRNIVREADPTIVYSGNTQGRNPKEAEAKGCHLVSMDSEGDFHLEFVPTDVVRFLSAELDVSDYSHIDEIIEAIKSKCDDISSKSDIQNHHKIIRLTLNGRTELNSTLNNPQSTDSIVDDIREYFQNSEPMVWLESLKVETVGNYDMDVLRKEGSFTSDVILLYDALFDGDGELRGEIEESEKTILNKGGRYLEEFPSNILDIAKESLNITLDKLLAGE